MHSSKHLINAREDAVQESINGFVYTNNTNLFTLNDYPNVVVRKDYTSLIERGKVALLSGGGSGHEPAHSGFIGKGMLTAAVCGNVFASPSSASILAALRVIGTKNKGGVLMIVKNYTGDRLNFGLAAKRAQLEGIQVESVLVNDDVALVKNNNVADDDDNSVGRRGLAGTLFIHKLAGALAEQNKSLDEIKTILNDVLYNHYIRTVGVSLSGGVDLPNSSVVVSNDKNKENLLEFDQIEIGLGIHGEAGKTRVKISNSYSLVKSVFQGLELGDSSSNIDVCLLVNNLGSLSNFEFNLLINDCCKYLLNERQNFNLKRLYAGASMTSLDMKGFSLTLFIVKNNALIDLLDYETNAFAWPNVYAVNLKEHLKDISRIQSAAKRLNLNQKIIDESKYVKFTSDELSKFFNSCLKMICNDLIDFKDYLNELDSVVGDGDTGNSLESIAVKILKSINEESIDFNYPHHVLTTVSVLVEQCGGTMSAILALGLSAAAQAFLLTRNNKQNNETTLQWLKCWSLALNDAVKAIQEYGRAKPNQRSLVDPLFAINEYLQVKIPEFENGKEDVSVKEVVKSLVNVAYESVMATAKMVPKVGRASYVDPNLITKPDAGAFAISSIISSIYKLFLNPNL